MTNLELPPIGLGTWSTFDVEDSAPLLEVLRKFFAAGGKLIDSSPMYGRAESVVGELLEQLSPRPDVFLATKVWTSGKRRGEAQMEESMRRMRARVIDLMQIHNLLDWRVHLPTLREWKAAGRIRYLGVTHYQVGAFEELEQIIRREGVDFVQLPYSAGMRAAEQRLLPAALETNTAVLVMRPFEEGQLLRRLRGKPVPEWAKEIDCASWPELLLKFIRAHPTKPIPIPATSNAAHLEANMRAARGPLPDKILCEKIAAAVTA